MSDLFGSWVAGSARADPNKKDSLAMHLMTGALTGPSNLPYTRLLGTHNTQPAYATRSLCKPRFGVESIPSGT